MVLHRAKATGNRRSLIMQMVGRLECRPDARVPKVECRKRERETRQTAERKNQSTELDPPTSVYSV